MSNRAGMKGRVGGGNFNGIDLMKFLGALLVIVIHTEPLSSYNSVIDFYLDYALARVAVPFFFLTSGYLFFRKMKEPLEDGQADRQVLFRYLKRILQIYLVWSVIYLPVHLYDLYRLKDFGVESVLELLLNYPFNFLFYGSYEHLWYLPALIASVALVYFLLKHLSVGKIVAMASAFYAAGALGDGWYNLVTGMSDYLRVILEAYLNIYKTTRSGLFSAFLLVALGAFIALRKVRIKWVLLPLAASLVLLYAESRFINMHGFARGYDVMFSVVPVAFFLFHFLLGLRLKDRPVYRYLRDSSILIYCSHLLVRSILDGLFPEGMDSLLRFGIVLVVSMAFSFGVLFLAKKERFGFLKRLY